MRRKRWGRIVGIQSSSVKQPVAGIDLSNGTRPGVAGLMKALMPDLAKDGITINLVLPGSFLTDASSATRPGTPIAAANLLAAAGPDHPGRATGRSRRAG